MNKLTSILAVLDGGPLDTILLTKAARLATAFRAHIELFSCDAALAYQLRRSYDGRDVDAAREASVRSQLEYLEQISASVAGLHLEVSSDASCESPLYEAIVRKVFGSRPDLVMKAPAGSRQMRHSALSSADWQLVRTCPAPLLFSGARGWPDRPRFAASVDVSGEETAGLAASIVRSAKYLSAGCGGELELLFGERSEQATQVREHKASLRRLAADFQLDEERTRLLSGDLSAILPARFAEQDYDVLVLGALTHRVNPAQLVGTLTRELLESLDCDFVLTRSASRAPSVHYKSICVTSVQAQSGAS